MSVPKQLGDYEVMSVLGRGASSTIYAVIDPADSHVYAVKHVVRNTPSDQRFIDQAMTEHEVASQVAHPRVRQSFRIIRRRKLVKTAELLVLMELVDGQPLEDVRPKSIERAVEVFHAVAEGLEAIHAAGYVHCDIKPNNIIFDGESNVKVIDLGQACPTNTVKRRIQGTPDFIAPEQVRRQPITAQTDVFNLGATMYWCLTNRHVPTLIPKSSGERIALRDESALVPIREINKDAPPALDALVMKCIEPDPSDRPSNMREVRQRLELVLQQASR